MKTFKNILEVIGLAILYLLFLALTIGIIYAFFAIPTYCIIQIIEAIKK